MAQRTHLQRLTDISLVFAAKLGLAALSVASDVALKWLMRQALEHPRSQQVLGRVP